GATGPADGREMALGVPLRLYSRRGTLSASGRPWAVGRWAGGPVGRWAGGPVGRWARWARWGCRARGRVSEAGRPGGEARSAPARLGVLGARLFAGAALGLLGLPQLLLLGEGDHRAAGIGRDGAVGVGDQQAVRLLVGALAPLVEGEPRLVHAVGVGEELAHAVLGHDDVLV